MSAKDQIKTFILENKDLSNKEIAERCNSTEQYVVKCKGELRKEGKLPAFDPMSRRKCFNEPVESIQPTTAEVDLKEKIRSLFRKKDVHTLEELSNIFDKGIGTIREAITSLNGEGFSI